MQYDKESLNGLAARINFAYCLLIKGVILAVVFVLISPMDEMVNFSVAAICYGAGSWVIFKGRYERAIFAADKTALKAIVGTYLIGIIVIIAGLNLPFPTRRIIAIGFAVASLGLFGFTPRQRGTLDLVTRQVVSEKDIRK